MTAFRSYQKEIQIAIESVREAALLAKQIQTEIRSAAFTKKDDSPVTIADFAVQAWVAHRLREAFPEDPLVGEEDAAELRENHGQSALEKVAHYLKPLTKEKINPAALCEWVDYGKAAPAKRFWTIDPIDGTKGFVRGDQFAVALALIEDGEVKAGVLGCPNLSGLKSSEISGDGALVAAVCHEGAWRTSLQKPEKKWQQLHVSTRQNTSQAILLRSYENQGIDSGRMEPFIAALGIKEAPVLMDSLAKYAYLAAGDADLLLRFPTSKHPYEYIWDQAAGVIAVEEAGGRVTDLNGKRLDFNQGRRLTANRGVVLSNGVLHDKILETLRNLRIE